MAIVDTVRGVDQATEKLQNTAWKKRRKKSKPKKTKSQILSKAQIVAAQKKIKKYQNEIVTTNQQIAKLNSQITTNEKQMHSDDAKWKSNSGWVEGGKDLWGM
jgi:hypothetical protein